MATGPLISIVHFILSYFNSFIYPLDTQGIRLCIQFQTYLQCPVHSPHNVTVEMTYFIL